jgi:uncharacterized MAPEG superfamily protein
MLPFFEAALVSALPQPSMFMARVHCWGSCVVRVLHRVFYIRQQPPHRTIAYRVGLLLVLLMVLTPLVKLL